MKTANHEVLESFSKWLDDAQADYLPFRLNPRSFRPVRSQYLFREKCTDFQVEEQLSFVPSGQGNHFFCWVEKEGMSTAHLVQRLSERWQIPRKNIGYAGRKDQRGLTRQWLSLPVSYFNDILPDSLDIEGVNLLNVVRNNKKLKLGQLSCNRFHLILRGPVTLPKSFEGRWKQVLAHGLPNYFGHQRFGYNLSNLKRIVPYLKSRQRARTTKDKFLISVFQSICFNYWLHQRLQMNASFKILKGDVMLGLPFGQRPFIEDDLNDLHERMRQGVLTVAGPLIGPRSMRARDEALGFEQQCLANMGLTHSFLSEHPALVKGARRPAFVPLLEPAWREEKGDLYLSFSLPKGSYATVLLSQILPDHVTDCAFQWDKEPV